MTGKSRYRDGPQRRWAGAVPAWSFFLLLWLAVTAVAVGLYVAGASG
jgi:hypothetical protein